MIGLPWLILHVVMAHEGDHEHDPNVPVNKVAVEKIEEDPGAKTIDNGQAFAEVDLPLECRTKDTWDNCPGLNLYFPKEKSRLDCLVLNAIIIIDDF